MPELLGRRDVMRALAGHLDEGHFVLLYGPRGVGKTAVLQALAGRCSAAGLAVGTAERTATLADLVAALELAYPGVDVDVTRQRARARLRLAAESSPCVLLLDHVGHVGTAFKSLLRSLRGTGSGVVLAADADNAREHERVRGLHLAHREIELPRLGAASIRALLRKLLATASVAHPPHEDDVERLVHAAEGLPGRATWFVAELAREAAWRDGRVRAEWLHTEALARSAQEILTRSAERLHS